MTKTRQWTIITVVSALIVLIGGWLLLVKPQHSHASSLRAQALSQQQSNQTIQTEIAGLQAEQRNLPREQKIASKFSTQVPANAAEPTVIRQLSAAASAAGVDLVSITPGAAAVVDSTSAAATGTTSLTAPATTGGQLVQLPVTLGVTGTYANVESFFQSLETLPRALLVTGWSLCPDVPTSAGAGPTGSGGAQCAPPATPANKTLPTGTIGGTLSATVFYAPPVTSTSASAGATTAPTTGTTSTTTSTTTPSTSATAPATTGSTPAPTAAAPAAAN